MKHLVLFLLTLFLSLQSIQAVENQPIQMARTPAPSPDGSELIFSYQGDLWKVAIDGGRAVRLTVHEANDYYPQWSPDGKEVAFSSSRFGNDDIFVMPSTGGLPEQLTFFSSNDRACDWEADGKTVLFTSNRDFYYGRMPVMYRVYRKKGGTPTKLLAAYVNNGKLSPDGQKLIYTRGRDDWNRKHYRGSSSTDVWLYDFKTEKFTRLTTHQGHDYYPMWSADGQTIYFVSDAGDDAFNIWRMDLHGGNKKQLTFHKDEGVRFPNISRNGKVIVYEQMFDLWKFDTATGQSIKLEIFAPSDLKENLVETKTFTNKASEFFVSPDEKQAAFVVRGDIFVEKLKKDDETGGTTQVTETWAREREINWAPNSDTLAYVSDRNGNKDIFLLFSENPEEKLYKTLKIKEVQITKSKENEWRPKFSPNGKKIAFIRGLGDLYTMDIDGKNSKRLLTGWSTPDFNWSPDSKWIAFSREDNEFNADVFIIPAEGGKAVNITQHPDDDYSPTWSQDGSKLSFISERYGNTIDIWTVFLQKKDDEKTKDEWEEEDEESTDEEDKTIEVKIDFKDIHKRLRRVTSLASSETNIAMSPDGETFAFSSNAEGKWDLYTVKWDRTGLKRLTNGNLRPGFIHFTKDGKKIYFMSRGTLNVISAEGKRKKQLAFKAKMQIDYKAERAQKFDEAWQILNDNYYDPNFHGADWDKMKKKYRHYALHATTIEDFNYVVHLMLGELNSSHLGISSSNHGPNITTGMLGLRFEESYKGKGLKVESVLPDSPCDQEKSKVMPGEILLSVDDVEITASTNLHQILNDKVNERVRIEVQSADGSEKRELVIRPINQRKFSNLEYKRWVDAKRAIVDEKSDGKLGYVHIQGMGIANVEQFEMELYSVAHGKDGLIIDVRNNGGGWTADILLAILAPKPHAYTIPRGGKRGYPEDRLPLYSWSKPVVTMCNEWSFSNAEIFSHAIKILGRGKVVGSPTGGLVISTGGTRLIDGSSFRIPYRGWYTIDTGMNQENNPCTPDIIIWEEPGDAAKGIDRQLEKAVEVMLQ